MNAQAIRSRDDLQHASCIVVKVGSSLLASLPAGVDLDFIQSLVDQLAALHAAGRKVVFVSSGAVAAGAAELKMDKRPKELPMVQAMAAVGQAVLMRLYRKAFAKYDIHVGQVLLTRDGLQDRQRYLHARNTLTALLDLRVIPIVNENDTVAVEELKLKMGDNDALAVSVSQLVDAEAMVLLTDVPGLYDRPPTDENADLISHVESLTPELIAAAGGSVSGVGSGGMSSKLKAALAASHGGVPLVVADGRSPQILKQIFDGGQVGTFFAPRENPVQARRHWIAFGRKPEGTLILDEGAVKALVVKKTSLLAIGIRDVQGDYIEGDTVSLCGPDGVEVARGLVNFTTDETRRILGARSEEYAGILGYDCAHTVVHRDNLLVLQT